MSKNLQSKSSIPASSIGCQTTFQNIGSLEGFFCSTEFWWFFFWPKKSGPWKGHHLKSRHDKYRTCRRFDLHLDHNRYRSPIVVEDAWPIPMVGPSGASDIKKIQQHMGLGVSQIMYSNPGCGQGQQFKSLFRGGVFRFRVWETHTSLLK